MPNVDNKSEEAVCNLALGHLGISEEISLLSTDRSLAAAACRRFFTTARDISQRDFQYPFTTKFATLSLVETQPNSEWLYAYRYPSDCLYFRRILSGDRNETPDARTPYRQSADSIGKLIFTDMLDAECEYTASVSNVLLWPDDLILATSYLLASMIAPRVTRGDGIKLGDRALQLYEMARSAAENNAEGEHQSDPAPEAESIRARA